MSDATKPSAIDLIHQLMDLGWDVKIKRPRWWVLEEKRKAKEAGAKPLEGNTSLDFISLAPRTRP